MAADAIPADAPDALNHPLRTPSPQLDQHYDSSSDDGDGAPLEGYAMLKFGDSSYVMTTLQLLIGRDMVAHRAAEIFNSHLDPFTTSFTQTEHNTIIYADVPVLTGDTNGDSGSPAEPQKASTNVDPPTQEDIDMETLSALFMKPRDTDPKATDTCPILHIHQPKPEGQYFPTGSNISRRHARIFYDHEEGGFMIHVLSKNGLFLNDALETVGQCVQLDHGTKVLIGSTEFTFELPNGGEESRIGYGFQNSQGDDIGAMYSSEEQLDSDLSDPHAYANDGLQYSSAEEISNSGSENSDDSGQSDEEEDEDEDQDEDEEVEQDTTEQVTNGTQKLKLNFSKTGLGAKGQGQKGQKSNKKPKAAITRPEMASKSKSKPTKKSSEPNGIKKVRDDDTPPKSKTTDKTDKIEGSPSEADKAQVSRDSEIVNGEGIFIEGLPLGAKIPPKKKGPGRPPKNGFLSKRELNQMSKAHKEAEKNGITDPNAAYLMMESKKAEKANKVAKGDGTAADGEDGDKDGSEVKKKTPRTARSPSPEMKLADYTEEQLQRPPDNYVVLIYEALVNHMQKKMNLQQIYSSIERRYPFFKFKTGTSGWQSSVRHNLGQNSTFQKVEKDGKGWMWGVVPGVTLESIREKKKKATPPPMPPPSTHHGAGSSGYQYGAPHPHSYPHAPGQSNAAGAHVYPHGQAMPPRPAISQPGNGQVRDGQIAGQPNIAQPGAVRQNTNMYAPAYPPGSQRAQIPNPHQPPPTYGQPSANRPAAGYGHNQPHLGASHPPNRSMSTTPSLPAERPKSIPRPSPDVIDTFISVFTSSFRDMKYSQEITEQKANFIVKNAVARVLEPESVANVPEDPSERAIITAFRKCLEQSQPRQDAGGVPRTYNNYLYPYASRTQSSVFGNVSSNRPGATYSTSGSIPAPATAIASRAFTSSPSTVGATTMTAGSSHTHNAPPPHPGRPPMVGITTTAAALPAISVPTSLPTSTAVPPRADTPNTAAGNIAIQAAAAVANASTSSIPNPPPANMSHNLPPRSGPSPTTTPIATSASLASSVQQLLSNAGPSTSSPRAPAVEPITPPAAPNASKRPIDTVDEAETQRNQKKLSVG